MLDKIQTNNIAILDKIQTNIGCKDIIFFSNVQVFVQKKTFCSALFGKKKTFCRVLFDENATFWSAIL